MMRARWNGPGSLSTPSGAVGAGAAIDAEYLDADSLAALQNSGKLILLDAPAATPAVMAPTRIVQQDEVAPNHSATTLPADPVTPTAPPATEKKKGKRK